MNLSAINLENLIFNLRSDLRKKFNNSKHDSHTKFLHWIITSGIHEYQAIKNDKDLKSELSAKALAIQEFTRLQEIIWNFRKDLHSLFVFPQDYQLYKTWFYTHAVGEHNLWNWISTSERQLVCKTKGPWQSKFLNQEKSELRVTAETNCEHLGEGVNLLGYVYGQLGIGEDVRMAARSLDAVGTTFSLVNFPPGHKISQLDMTFSDRVSVTGDKRVNIFCLTALEHGRFYAERGPSQIQGRYNIGYWPWELSKWPNEWRQLIHLVDEIWVSSQHTLESLSPICASLNPRVKIFYMPLAVPVQVKTWNPSHIAAYRSKNRKLLSLPINACLFCFAFDLNSSIYRKNPELTLKAFLKAFPKNEFNADQVGLVIKVHPPAKQTKGWNTLKELAQRDNRLHIIEATLARTQLLEMYQTCDAFVSLHRAEGFGRAIAEALQLGLRVIATNYSGNVDFCSRPEFSDRVKLIPFSLIKVRPGQYPYSSGQVWASPNSNAASKAMREVATEVLTNKGELLPVPEGGWPVSSEIDVGNRYKKRLAEIYQEMGF